MFNKQNNDEKKKVNTRSMQMFNKDGFYPSTMVLGLWDNSFFTFKIHDKKDNPTEKEVFDYNKGISTAINLEKAMVILEGLREEIIPALKDGKEKSIGVNISGTNVFVVGTKCINETVVPYVGIFVGLNESRRPESFAMYELKSSQAILNYNHETGDFEHGTVNSEILLLERFLSEGIKALTNSVAHSIRVVDNFYRTKLDSTLASIASATGAESKSWGGGYSSKNNNIFGTPSSSDSKSDDGDTAQINTLGSLDDL